MRRFLAMALLFQQQSGPDSKPSWCNNIDDQKRSSAQCYQQTKQFPHLLTISS